MQDIIEGTDNDDWFWIIGTVDDFRIVVAKYDLSFFDDNEAIIYGSVTKSLAVRFVDDKASKIMIFTLDNIGERPGDVFERNMINTIGYIRTPSGLLVMNSSAYSDIEQDQDSCLAGIDLTRTFGE